MAEYIDKEEILKMTNSYKNELGRLKADPFVKCGIETVEGFINEQPIADVIPIPEGATNGDMFLLANKNATIFEEEKNRVQVVLDKTVDNHIPCAIFNKTWWNAPYKGGCNLSVDRFRK